MNAEKDKLIKEFPVFFDQNAEESPFKHRGIEIDIGWIPLVREMIQKLEAQAKLEKRTDREAVKCAQIKEKFGLLRCYLTNSSKAMQEIVNEFAAKSASICESCGAPGKRYTDGWERVKCEACEKYRQEKIDERNR